jgi:hypothetical protein
MNWTELRPKLRKEFGNQFGFFNDKYRSGTRRVKIYGVSQDELKKFILKQDVSLNVNDYDWKQDWSCSTTKCVTIHFNE